MILENDGGLAHITVAPTVTAMSNVVTFTD